MYASCLYCHAALGSNRAVEQLPIGRRIAFDAARGRLWVVCGACMRWNLSPFDEREEAIEQCERLFRGTRLRFSTDNIGLGRARDGTELVRVGNALRPEMAAWRFGAQLARRRQRYRWLVAGWVVAGAGVAVGLKTAGFSLFALRGSWTAVENAYERATRLRLPHPKAEKPLSIEIKQARAARWFVDDPTSLGLAVDSVDARSVHYRGSRLIDVAPKVLARLNFSGHSILDERRAVDFLVDAAATPAPSLFEGLLGKHNRRFTSQRPLGEYDSAFTLAIEMALHEDRERVALAGELLGLEAAWREAEELANIADSLVPSSVDRALASLRRKLG